MFGRFCEKEKKLIHSSHSVVYLATCSGILGQDFWGIRPERGRDGRTGRTGRTDGTDGTHGRDGWDGRDGRTGRTDCVSYRIVIETLCFCVFDGRSLDDLG